MAKRKRRAFTKEFKAQTVRVVRESGKSVGAVARELNLTETALRRWVQYAEVVDRVPPSLPEDPGPESATRPKSCKQGLQLPPALMRRVFDIDVLACPRCGGPRRVIATVQDPVVVRMFLAHLGLPESPGPAPPAPAAIG